MTRLRVQHPSEVLAPLLVYGATAGLAMAIAISAVINIVPAIYSRHEEYAMTVSEAFGYAIITAVYGAPIGAVAGLLTALASYAVLRVQHRRAPAISCRARVVASASTAAVVVLAAGIWLVRVYDTADAGSLAVVLAFAAMCWPIAAFATISAVRRTERKLNAGRPNWQSQRNS